MCRRRPLGYRVDRHSGRMTALQERLAEFMSRPYAFPTAAMALFLLELILTLVAPNFRRLFLPRYGRRHRMMGAVYIAVLIVGLTDIAARVSSGSDDGESAGSGAGGAWFDAPGFPLDKPGRVAFDVLLGVAGTTLTLTAAYDFKHAHEEDRVQNKASGPLDPDQTVTFEEMLEHSFYQALNLCQVAFLHLVARVDESDRALGRRHMSLGSLAPRLTLLSAVTVPWVFRGAFPTNRFSDNYDAKKGRDPWGVTSVLYRMKKYQYVFYKHFMLHGLNVGVAIDGFEGLRKPRIKPPGLGPGPGLSLVDATPFRLYWLGLNAAYVMEFFLQTLVKRRYLTQGRMLRMNQFLMLVSTASAVAVLRRVSVVGSVVSLAVNFARASGECGGVALAAAAAAAWRMAPGSPEYGYGGFLAGYDAVEDGHALVWTLALAAVALTPLERGARTFLGKRLSATRSRPAKAKVA